MIMYVFLVFYVGKLLGLLSVQQIFCMSVQKTSCISVNSNQLLKHRILKKDTIYHFQQRLKVIANKSLARPLWKEVQNC